MTLYQLETAISENINKDNLDAYKDAIEEKNSITGKSSLQTLVSDVNEKEALKAIQGYAENDDASELTLYQLETAISENINKDNLDAYKDAIEEKNSITGKSSLQTLVSDVNEKEALKAIRGYAENDDASDLTRYQLKTVVSKNVNWNNLDAYKVAIEEKDSIPDKASLQALVSDVNEKETLKVIQGYAKIDDASDLTRYQLERAGIKNINRGNLEAYKEAIVGEDSIPDKKSLQSLVLDVNAKEALKFIQDSAERNDPYGLDVERLETSGAKKVNEDNLEVYKKAIANEDSIADLEALQTVINNVNNATKFEKTYHKYNYIKINGKIYEVDDSISLLNNMGITKTKENEYVTGQSEIDIGKNQSGVVEISGGIYSLLLLGTKEYNIEETKNPYLDGKITFDHPYGITKKELEENTDFSIGYEKDYESATEIVEDRWIEYKDKIFKNPSDYNDKFPHKIEYNDIPFFVFEPMNVLPDVSINDMFDYLGINAKINLGKNDSLSYMEIEYE